MNHHNRPGPDGNLWRGIASALSLTAAFVIGLAGVLLVAQIGGCDRTEPAAIETTVRDWVMP